MTDYNVFLKFLNEKEGRPLPYRNPTIKVGDVIQMNEANYVIYEAENIHGEELEEKEVIPDSSSIKLYNINRVVTVPKDDPRWSSIISIFPQDFITNLNSIGFPEESKKGFIGYRGYTGSDFARIWFLDYSNKVRVVHSEMDTRAHRQMTVLGNMYDFKDIPQLSNN